LVCRKGAFDSVPGSGFDWRTKRRHHKGLAKDITTFPDIAVENGRVCHAIICVTRRDGRHHEWFVDCASMNEPRGTTFDSSSQGILQTLEGLLSGMD